MMDILCITSQQLQALKLMLLTVQSMHEASGCYTMLLITIYPLRYSDAFDTVDDSKVINQKFDLLSNSSFVQEQKIFYKI